MTRKLGVIAEKIRLNFSSKDSAREKVLRLCREIIRNSANVIRAVHRREYEEAEKLLLLASNLVKNLSREITTSKNELLHSGFVHDAEKEFVEASITFSIIKSQSFPTPEQLQVNYPAYLNGMAESIGELRRFLLDSLRRDDFSRCEELLSIMDDDLRSTCNYGFSRCNHIRFKKEHGFSTRNFGKNAGRSNYRFATEKIRRKNRLYRTQGQDKKMIVSKLILTSLYKWIRSSLFTNRGFRPMSRVDNCFIRHCHEFIVNAIH